jgi:hypothetical protein
MASLTHIYSLKIKSLGYVIAGAILTISCQKDSVENVDAYDYFPLSVGSYIVYDVHEETYSSAQANPVIKNTQERDEVEEASTDENGISTYILSRSTRNNATESWQKVKEYTIQRYPDKLLTNIDNQVFFSMVFPVDSKVTWNGNTYNNRDAEDYYYEDIHSAAEINGKAFPQTLKVVERNDTSIINRYFGVKQYALGVGLISDEQINYEFCQNESCIGSGKIESGSLKTRKIVESGGNVR